MKGTDIGPTFAKPGRGGNLSGDVRLTGSKGCAPFDYGFGTAGNQPPTVKIEVKPHHPRAGHLVTFNGSSSYDDKTPSSKLKFRWDFNGDGKTDAIGATVRHRFSAGKHRVRLTVIDTKGAKATGSVVVRVRR
ncbi:MAG: PKD domain-containing protein [Frankiales bacterium]|nr:PKD domain-containing protein [Frankiales bacterium]